MSKNIIRKGSEKFVAWCADTSPGARLERTVVQGIIGVAAGALSGVVGAPPWFQMVVVPTVMAVIVPIQAAIGEGNERA